MGDSKMISHNITFGGIVLLKRILSSPGWYEGKDSIKNCINAAELLENHFAEEKFVPPEKDEKKIIEWEKTELALELKDNLRDTVRACLAFYLKKAAFHPSKHVAKLITEFGVAE